MATTIDAYYDFRSPYAYFANHRIRSRSFVMPVAVAWQWRPVSIDVLLNLQAGRDAWAAYVDPLRAPKPPRPNSIPALCTAALLDPEAHAIFRNAVFDALWQQQRDIADPEVL